VEGASFENLLVSSLLWDGSLLCDPNSINRAFVVIGARYSYDTNGHLCRDNSTSKETPSGLQWDGL
jgi:hypothetical protein